MGIKNNDGKVKYKNLAFLVLCIVALILCVFFVFKLLLVGKKPITFKEKYLNLEYGTKVDWKDIIEEVDPANAKITYPDVSLLEVGNYHLTFKIKDGDKVIEQEQEFVVKDTKTPKIIKKVKGEVQVPSNREYDIFANVHDIKNLSEEAKINKVLVDSKLYDSTLKKIKKAQKKLIEREITKSKDIVKSETQSNYILYKTDFSSSKEGNYTITMLAVDENYNTDELSWEIKVVPEGELVNIGGSVTCKYPSEDIKSSKAYNIEYEELYTYDEHLLVSKLDFITNMVFNEDYATNDNIQILVDEINNKYGEYQNHKGITVKIQTSSENVMTHIIVDFDEYDLKNDPLNLLESKKDGKVKIENVVKRLKDKANCVIK